MKGMLCYASDLAGGKGSKLLLGTGNIDAYRNFLPGFHGDDVVRDGVHMFEIDQITLVAAKKTRVAALPLEIIETLVKTDSLPFAAVDGHQTRIALRKKNIGKRDAVIALPGGYVDRFEPALSLRFQRLFESRLERIDARRFQQILHRTHAITLDGMVPGIGHENDGTLFIDFPDFSGDVDSVGGTHEYIQENDSEALSPFKVRKQALAALKAVDIQGESFFPPVVPDKVPQKFDSGKFIIT